MYVDRYPYSMGLFNVESDEFLVKELSPQTPIKREGGYISGVSFALKKPGLIADVDVPIIGFNILRKHENKWKKVTTKLYTDIDKNGYPKIHQGFDGDSSLEEGKLYEYKIVALGETDKIDSPIMKAKLLPSFTYSLYQPENFKQVSLEQAQALSYSCKVSDSSFAFNEGVVDYINA